MLLHLQRMLLRLQCYDITLMYKKGKYMYLADTSKSSKHASLPALLRTTQVMTVSYISTAHLEELRQHTAEDEVLQTVSAVI